MRHGYRRVRADRGGLPACDLAEPRRGGFDRAALLSALHEFCARRGIEANWSAVEQLPDDGLVTTLAMVCPFQPAEKQVLLEAPDTAARARDLLTLLMIGAHEPAEDAAKPS
jgi:Lon protease-like protein